MNQGIPQLLDAWQGYITHIEEAIENHSNRYFQLWFKKGDRCCKQIKRSMRFCDENELSEHKEHIVQLTTQWLALVDKIKPWRDATEEKYNRCKARRQKNKRINKAYGFKRSAGKTVKMKAR